MSFRRGLVVSGLTGVSVVSALLLVAACSSSSTPSDAAASPDGEDAAVTSPTDAGAKQDAPVTQSDAPSGTCEGACKVTSLEVDIGGKKRTLVRAQFGTQPGDGGVELHTESHLGGLPACPETSSPSPDYTLIVTSVPPGAKGRKVSDRDGVISTLFDFKGDLGLPPFTKAVSVNLTVVDEDTMTPPRWVALDVSAMFREGEVKGHLYAEYCPSLSE